MQQPSGRGSGRTTRQLEEAYSSPESKVIYLSYNEGEAAIYARILQSLHPELYYSRRQRLLRPDGREIEFAAYHRLGNLLVGRPPSKIIVDHHVWEVISENDFTQLTELLDINESRKEG